MNLSGQQRQKIQEAFINAFPTMISLEQMLAHELNRNLRAIAGEGNLQDIAFKLIQAAESQGWVKDLVRAACKSNPDNSSLKAVAEELLININSTKIILFLSANPVDIMKGFLDKEVREINNVLKKVSSIEPFKLEQCWTVTLNDIRQAFLKHNPQIVHFSGQGITIKGLAIADDVGAVNIVPTEDLKRLYCNFSKIECIVLNVCFSENQANAIVNHIDYVIGLRPEIGDRAAMEFTKTFYASLKTGLSIEESYKKGCKSIIDFEKIPKEFIRILKKEKKLENLSTYKTEATKLILRTYWEDHANVSDIYRQILDQRILDLHLLPEEAHDIENTISTRCKKYDEYLNCWLEDYRKKISDHFYSNDNSDKLLPEFRLALREMQSFIEMSEEKADKKVVNNILSVIYTNLGNHFVSQETAYAKILFDEAAAFNQNNPFIYQGFASIWFKKKNYYRALVELNKAKQLFFKEKKKENAKEIDLYIQKIDSLIDKIPISNYIAYQFVTVLRLLSFKSVQK